MKNYILLLSLAVISHSLLAQNSFNAYQFDGVNDYIDVPSTALNSINTGNFTIEAWIRGDDESVQNTHPIIFSNRTGTQTDGMKFFFHNYWGGAQYKMLCVQLESNNYFLMNNGSFNNKILDGTCHHVAITKQSDSLSFFVDGLMIGKLFAPASASVSSPASIRIGDDRLINSTFKGEISQVRIWNTARSQSEINNAMSTSIPGNTPNLLSYWELNDDDQFITDKTSNANGQLGSTGVADANDPQLVTNQCTIEIQNGIYGQIYNDFNQNCVKDNEPYLSGQQNLIIYPGNITVQSNGNGSWYVDSLPTGTYTVFYDTSGNWKASCPNPQTFTITNPDSAYFVDPFGMYNINPCSEPTVSVLMPFMRPCVSNQKIHVQGCNRGLASGPLYDAYVLVKLDSMIQPSSSSIPYTMEGEYYRFELDTLNPGQCFNFTINASVSCNAIMGQTLCMEAELLPLDSCVLETHETDTLLSCTSTWDKSSLQVDGWCENDTIYFTITNTGDPIDGDMDCFSEVRVFIDGQYTLLDSIQLTGGATDTFSFAGNGKTWRLEADQHPLHPGNSNPNATVELCGDPANWTPDLVNILPHDDADPVKDIYCGIVTTSYDPNDKTGYPLGVTSDNFIGPNGYMEYVIRFQNTGTDTAFNIVIKDTLDENLNIFSVKSGVSSHNYDFKMHSQRVLEWTFNNIMLPDSNVNLEGSNGFVTFKVEQNPNLPDGTEINNSAGIYFDFNTPIITNKTSHIVNRSIYDKNINDDNTTVIFDDANQSKVIISPNPSSGLFHLDLSNLLSVTANITVVDQLGKMVKEIQLSSTNQMVDIDLSTLGNGMYFLFIKTEHECLNHKLIKK